ncbi:MAG: hypothetical protein HQL46_08805 [Gammaproteobacteria bacterium]|nr:hypothetical protein [Gammaproteobacteria bacterium]
MLATIADWIWNPIFSFLYLEIGIIVLLTTGFIAWTNLIPQLKRMWRERHQNLHQSSHDNHISPKHAFITS